MGAAAEGGANSSHIRCSGISDAVDAWMAGRKEYGVAGSSWDSDAEYSFVTFESRSKEVYFIHF